ncbi:CHAT domain-containing protein [Paractinoplanes toevensis]|uniref:CHAT domain-containing protein n=1 Tax=Paractinoplanes toevensis TaxID=571911 RepID=A0A919W3V9_9ACTN|nr:CHAT domain-containing protein [Actinoplanes toevensis]GIM93214.1 hypothetical protein Ato02nite_050070 [Actinoplanes toevensis]
MTSYPVVRTEFLKDVPGRGLLGLGKKRRDVEQLPKAGTHEVWVLRVEGRYIVGRGEFRTDDENLVRADCASLVNVSSGMPVTVEMTIPSAEAINFTMRITFACTVTDAAQVVRENVQASASILAYLQRDSKLGHLALNLRMSDLDQLRREATARIRAYTEVKPPGVHGLDLRFLGVEVLTPQNLHQFEKKRREAEAERRLAWQRTGDSQDAERHTQGLAGHRRGGGHAAEEADQEQAHDRAVIEQSRLRAEQLKLARREVEFAFDAFGGDPEKAMIFAQAQGEIDAKELAERMAEVERDRVEYNHRLDELDREEAGRRQMEPEILRAEREQALESRREGREDRQEILDMQLDVLRELAKRGHLDMINVNVEKLVSDIYGSGEQTVTRPHHDALPESTSAPGSSAERDEHTDTVTAGMPPHEPRNLVAEAPSQVAINAAMSVVISIRREYHQSDPGSAVASLRNLVVAPGGTAVTVTVHPTPSLQVVGQQQLTMLVTPGGDPDPGRFEIVARDTGLHRMDLKAWAGGSFLASLSIEVAVTKSGAQGPALSRAAELHTDRARPGEATMEVRYAGDHYQFQLRSELALFPPVVMPAGRRADTAIEQALNTMRQLAVGTRHHDEVTVRRLLRASGVRLWKEMVPEVIREQFWQIRSHITALTIATDYDVIPWEILYPLDHGHDDGFLVERIPVVRLTYGQFRSPRLAIRDPHFIVPSQGPHNVAAEIAAIRDIVGGGEPITRISAFLEILESGRMGAAHFACHNAFDHDGSRIEMDDGSLEPWMLSSAQASRSLATTQPVVFINACRSAGVAPSYTNMVGWAQQFMNSGAGAFVGTLWAVRSTSSADFATAFYQSLTDGLSLGEAARAARTAKRDDLLDPTWLAYTVHGDPFAVAI